MNFDDNKELFVEEARDLLAKMESALLSLEKDPGSGELINEVFRALHTIKGSGAMFGFDGMSAFAHGFENMFDDMRKGLVGVSRDIIGLSLRSLDCLSAWLDSGEAHKDQAAIERELEAIKATLRSGSSPATTKPAAEPAAEPAVAPTVGRGRADVDSDGLTNLYRIRFKPNRDLLTRGVKVENLFGDLAELGQYYAYADVDAVPCLDAIDPTSLYLSWIIDLSTAAPVEDIRSVFIFVEDYAEIGIERLEVVDQTGKPSVPRIGEILANRGALAPDDIDAIHRKQKPFGELAVESGKLSKPALEAALAEQRMAKAAAGERESRKESSNIRVRKEKLDYLIDAVGELVILEARLRQEARVAGATAFESIAENLGRLTSDLRDATMNIRMVPLEESFSGFHRLVRDLASQLGKEIDLVISGANTEMDKNIIEALKDPLVHIIRNSADHGIEAPELRAKLGKSRAGTIRIEARQQGSKVEIAISDDGAGLDLERIKAKGVERGLIDATEKDPKRIMPLIFEPSFSTAARTTGVSGRGVGMDVVKSNLERLRGEIAISSESGLGTRILLSIPLTLVIVDGLLVRVGDVMYVLALNQVEECVDVACSEVLGDGRRGIINLRGKTIPIIDLRDAFGLDAADDAGLQRLVIVDAEGMTVGFRVDGVIGKQQVVIKPFTMGLRQVPTIAGATILGDGSVAFILNIRELFKSQRQSEPLAREGATT